MSKPRITQQDTVNSKSVSACVNVLKAKFVRDMELAGMTESSRSRYIFSVDRLIKHYWCSPAELTEQHVSDYIVDRQRQKPAKGTFKSMHCALRFFFQATLERDWPLFKKK